MPKSLFSFAGLILSWVRAFQPFTKKTLRNHQKNHSKIIKKSTQNQVKIHSQIISSFSAIFCKKNASPGSHFEDRFWKAFWLPFGSIWLAKLLLKRIQAAPGAQGGSKSVPRSPRTPKSLPKWSPNCTLSPQNPPSGQQFQSQNLRKFKSLYEYRLEGKSGANHRGNSSSNSVY